MSVDKLTALVLGLAMGVAGYLIKLEINELHSRIHHLQGTYEHLLEEIYRHHHNNKD